MRQSPRDQQPCTTSASLSASFSLYFIIWHIFKHEIHHRGELSLILGLFGREGLEM